MDTEPSRIGVDLERATAEELEELLVHHDELDAPSLERLASHPVHGRTLAVLRGAELWLSQAEPEDLFPPDACPTAEELYDFGRGPGFEIRESEHEVRISAHLETCLACRELVTSLEENPPLPLQLGDEEEVLSPHPQSLPRGQRSRLQLAILATAASLLLAFFFVPGLFSPRPLADLPERPTYRGLDDSSLLFPRGLVLARGPKAGEEDALPTFELEAIAGADSYHVEVFRHGGSAFERGQLVQSLQANEPTLSGSPLPPGRYTWQAWALVQGLERELGAREFEIRADVNLNDRLAQLGASPSTSELVQTVRLLHDAGYESDARELARALPDCCQRDTYLRPPGR